jgi:hypothetical protein
MGVTSGITAFPMFRLLKFSVSAVAWTTGVLGSQLTHKFLAFTRNRDYRGAFQSETQHSPTDEQVLKHDPEKWSPFFGKDHAPAKRYSGMTIKEKSSRSNVNPGVE